MRVLHRRAFRDPTSRSAVATSDVTSKPSAMGCNELGCPRGQHGGRLGRRGACRAAHGCMCWLMRACATSNRSPLPWQAVVGSASAGMLRRTLQSSVCDERFSHHRVRMGDGARLAESSAVLARIMLLVEDLACSNRVWSCELGYGVFVRWYHVLRKYLTRWRAQPCSRTVTCKSTSLTRHRGTLTQT